jgi:hypothetical protein
VSILTGFHERDYKDSIQDHHQPDNDTSTSSNSANGNDPQGHDVFAQFNWLKRCLEINVIDPRTDQYQQLRAVVEYLFAKEAENSVSPVQVVAEQALQESEAKVQHR